MPVKNTQYKREKPRKLGVQNENAIGSAPASSISRDRRFELDEHDRLMPSDERIEEDPLSSESETEDITGDESGIEEELDPFGDAWEK
jgi:hypothetical protein